MAAPAMSHLICSMALVGLILVLPAFFAMERDRYAEAMAIRELTEISDYTSNTIENLFLLANSTNTEDLTITKELLYLPLTVEDSPYVLNITSADGQYASQIVAYLTDRPWIVGTSWLVPGLKITANSWLTVGNYTVEAGCSREPSGFYVWIEESE
jgi:hypothetical protein